MLVGKVRTLPSENLPDVKTQAVKILEEAAEVYSASEDWLKTKGTPTEWSYAANPALRHLMSECADVIMATCNMMQILGVSDIEPFMKACEQRQMDRGRYDIQKSN